jgi:dTMP kinase
MKRGKFIVFEGMDGSGKSTAVQLMYDRLQELQIPVVKLRIPGGTEVGEQLRSILLSSESNLEKETEFLLMQATRIEAYNKIIKPAIDEGIWVLCDRFCTSSFVYQHTIRGVNKGLIQETIDYTTPDTIINCSLYIRRPFDNILAHLDKKEKDHFESVGQDVLKNIFNEYEYLTSDVYSNWIVVNNDGELDKFKHKIHTATDLLSTVGCSGMVI